MKKNLIFFGILVIFSLIIFSQEAQPIPVPQEYNIQARNCSLGYTLTSGVNSAYQCVLCKVGFGLAFDANTNAWICIQNTVDKCAQYECEPYSKCNCKCIKCACGYGLFQNSTVTQCWNNEFFVRQCEYYGIDGSCQQCKYTYDTALLDLSPSGNNYGSWLALDYGLYSGNCINNRDSTNYKWAVPHCHIYSIDTNSNNEVYCSQCHQTYRMYLSINTNLLGLFYPHTYVAYYKPNTTSSGTTTTYKACLKVPYQYDDQPTIYNKNLDFSKYVTQSATTGDATTVFCDETTYLFGNFDTTNKQVSNTQTSSGGICPNTRAGTSTACYYVVNSQGSLNTFHMGCYGGSGLFPTVNNNVLALCQLWSSRVDNYTAVCTKCSNPNDNTKKYLPDITGQYCYEITSFKLKSLIANCQTLENKNSTDKISCIACTDNVNNQIIGVPGNYTCAPIISNCRVYYSGSSNYDNGYVLGICQECHQGFTVQSDLTTQVSQCTKNYWANAALTQGIPGCQIYNILSGSVDQTKCFYNSTTTSYLCKQGFTPSTTQQEGTNTQYLDCTCSTRSQFSNNQDICPLNATQNCTQYYGQIGCSICPSGTYQLSSDEVQCSAYTATSSATKCSASTAMGVCQYCDPKFALLKSNYQTKNCTDMTALKAANASFASIADTCLYVNDGPSPSCDYDTVTQGLTNPNSQPFSQYYDKQCVTPIINQYGGCSKCQTGYVPPSGFVYSTNFNNFWFFHYPYCVLSGCIQPFIDQETCLLASSTGSANAKIVDIYSPNGQATIYDSTIQLKVIDISTGQATPQTYCDASKVTASSTDISIQFSMADYTQVTKTCIDNPNQGIQNCQISQANADPAQNSSCLVCKSGYKLNSNTNKCDAQVQADIDGQSSNLKFCQLNAFQQISLFQGGSANDQFNIYTMQFCQNCSRGYIPTVVDKTTITITNTNNSINTINECILLSSIAGNKGHPACRVAQKQSDSSYLCWKCELGHYLTTSDSSCVYMPQNCLIVDLAASAWGKSVCSTCKYGYVFTNTSKLSCSYNQISNCVSYGDMHGTVCTACSSGYYVYTFANSTQACIPSLCKNPNPSNFAQCIECYDMKTYFLSLQSSSDLNSGICTLRKNGNESSAPSTSYQYDGSTIQIGQYCDPSQYNTTIRNLPDCTVCLNQNQFNLTCNRDPSQIKYFLNTTKNITFTYANGTTYQKQYAICAPIHNQYSTNCQLLNTPNSVITNDNCTQCLSNYYLNLNFKPDPDTYYVIQQCVAVDANCIQSNLAATYLQCSKCKTGLPNNDCIYPSLYTNYQAYYIKNSTTDNTQTCAQVSNCMQSDGINNICLQCSYPQYGLLSESSITADYGTCINNLAASPFTTTASKTVQITNNCKTYKIDSTNLIYTCSQCHDTYFMIYNTYNQNNIVIYCVQKSNCLQLGVGVTLPNITTATGQIADIKMTDYSCGKCVPYSQRQIDAANNNNYACSNTITTEGVDGFGCAQQDYAYYYSSSTSTATVSKYQTCIKCQSNQCQNFVLVQTDDGPVDSYDGFSNILPKKCMNNDHQCAIDNCNIIRTAQYNAVSNASTSFYLNFERLMCGQCLFGFDLNAGSADCDTFSTTNDGITNSLVTPTSGQSGNGTDGGYIPPTPQPKPPGPIPDGPTPTPPGPNTYGKIQLNFGLELILLFVFGVIAIIY